MYTRPALREALRYAVDLINSYQQETERAETFKAIVDFTHSGIIGTNSEFKITTFNPSAEKILGIKSGDVIGKQFNEFFPEFQVTILYQKSTPSEHSIKVWWFLARCQYW